MTRGEETVPRDRLPVLLAAPQGSMQEGVLIEVLAAIRETSSSWAAPFFWRALLTRRFTDPLGETARNRLTENLQLRGVLEETRLLGEQLFSLPPPIL